MIRKNAIIITSGEAYMYKKLSRKPPPDAVKHYIWMRHSSNKVWGEFYLFFLTTVYSTLLHLPPLRLHCADGCCDRTQDRCNWCIGSQTL